MTDLTATTVQGAAGSVEVFRGGQGGPAPLVYLHSANGEGAGLAMLEQLADSRLVFAPMFPGFGASEGLDAIDDIEDASFHLLDVLDRLGLSSVDLVGQSLGGWMAAELAVRWPERVRRMVLVNAVGLHVDESPITEIFGRDLGELAGELFADPEHPVAQIMRAMGALDAGLAEIPFDMVRPLAQAQAATAKIGWNPYLHDPKLRRRLERVSAPTLVVHGAKDGIVGRPHADAYVEGIPDATLLVVEDAAHLATLERPDELAKAITAHLGG
ncbi:MAG: alpha/beta fold hydrolase [Acidimicrobiales bacterium]